MGFWGFLALMLIGLKLTGYITWSWLWVLAPLWAGAILWLVFVVICLAIAYVSDGYEQSQRNFRRRMWWRKD